MNRDAGFRYYITNSMESGRSSVIRGATTNGHERAPPPSVGCCARVWRQRLCSERQAWDDFPMRGSGGVGLSLLVDREFAPLPVLRPLFVVLHFDYESL